MASENAMKLDMFSYPEGCWSIIYLSQSACLAQKELLKNRPEWSGDIPAAIFKGRTKPEITDKFPVYRKFERDTDGALILPSNPKINMNRTCLPRRTFTFYGYNST